MGSQDAAAYSRSALFSGTTIPVVARFSLAGGNPKASDTEKSPRGMALEFQLADGSRQHMTMLNTPMFFATMPRTFLDKMLALKPDPATGKPNPDALKAFAATHPDNKAQAEFLADHNPPPSYANSAYFGIHTFKFINKDNKTTLVKLRFAEDGEKALTDAELTSMPADFLDAFSCNAATTRFWAVLHRPGASRKSSGCCSTPIEELPPGLELISLAGEGLVDLVINSGRRHPSACSTDWLLLWSYAVSFVKRLQGQ